MVCKVGAWRKRSRGLGRVKIGLPQMRGRKTRREEAQEEFLGLPVRG